MIRNIFKRLVGPLLQYAAKKYTTVPREYCYKNLTLTIFPSVFHPAFYLSTNCLINFFADKNLKDKKVWELGAGSGLFSLYTAQQGAIVTATDINPVALSGIEANAKRNRLSVEVIHSDLFEKVGNRFFDYIVINPPYYPQEPKNDTEKAFYCGPAFEYFHSLFEGLVSYFTQTPLQTEVIMILSEDCRIDEINAIAVQKGLNMTNIWQKRVWGEWNYIFIINN